MNDVRVCVLRTAGTNCDRETAHAFSETGAAADLVHINELTRKEKRLESYHILAIPGGFTYGDDIASGKILANELKFKIESDLRNFIRDGKLIIGICNGFQVLVKAGLLPNLKGNFKSVESTLTLNDSNKFEDRWIYLKSVKCKKESVKCVWTKGIDGIITLPIAHGEGKFIPKEDATLKTLEDDGLIIFKYVDKNGRRSCYPDNPNGSVADIAGICDRSGRIFGLMPHPERHMTAYQHPSWTRMKRSDRNAKGDGYKIFENGVKFAKINLSNRHL